MPRKTMFVRYIKLLGQDNGPKKTPLFILFSLSPVVIPFTCLLKVNYSLCDNNLSTESNLCACKKLFLCSKCPIVLSG